MLALWLIFPGLALSQLIPPYGFWDALRGMGSTLFLTLLFVALSLFATLRFRRSLWFVLTGVTVASVALVYVVVLLLRA
jgi:hypothetical protein